MLEPCPDRAARRRNPVWGSALLCCALLVGCGGGGGGGSAFQGVPGSELAKPGGGTFFLDEHHDGGASRLRLIELVQGRLVDVHGLQVDGSVDPEPAFRDLLVRESVQSDGLNYRLEVNPITQRARLVVLRERGAEDTGSGTFEALLRSARSDLLPVITSGESGGVVSLVPRNACLSLRFDDLLADDAEAAAELVDTLRLVTGTPPRAPFLARLFFDPNHGGTLGDAFHSTRILVDLTTSAEEAVASPYELPINALGLPPSLPGDARASVSIRLPTRLDAGAGIFELLTNLSGAPLDRRGDGPVDPQTFELVRAFRAGRADDGNNGFLLDLNKPELIGAWPLSVSSAVPDPSGPAGRQFVVDLRFSSPCRQALEPGDVIAVGELLLEPVERSTAPDVDGEISSARLRLLTAGTLANGNALLGGGLFQTTYASIGGIPPACWIELTPPAATPPATGLLPEVQIGLRFSEPMDPASLDPFENLRLVRGGASVPVQSENIVVAQVGAGTDLRTFRLTPLLPLAYLTTGEYRLELSQSGLTDLAGNSLAAAPPPFVLVLDEDAPLFDNGGVVLRFNELDELPPIGKNDLRGQLFYDFSRGIIRGRTPVYESFAADQSNPVPSIMIPFLPGVQTPLSGLGSKLQTVWRYCDLGWQVEDEARHNLDVVGLNWSPAGGTVLNDFFERFEIRLAHSRRQPDEARTFTGTFYPCSGVGAGERICTPCLTFVPYEDNVLLDPRSPQRVVHERSLGYRVQNSDVFVGVSGTRLMPFPMNRAGAPFVSYTWRDTAVLAKDGADSGGIPLKIETTEPLQLVPGPVGRIAPASRVPAWGLPLLMEFRCYPSNSALGLNPVSIYLAQNAQQLPCFRAYTTGGTDESRQQVRVDPDLALFPEGGFNPGSRPPGQRTTFQADNSFYVGQLDTVVRVSRCHTVWHDSLLGDPHYFTPVVSPRPDEQPPGTRIELEFRGAAGFTGQAVTDAFDANALDPLGDVLPDEVQFFEGDGTWTASLEELSGARYLQLRITFVNNIEALIFPELSSVGIAFEAR